MCTCGTPCHEKSFSNKIYMAFCATNLNIVTVTCSFHAHGIENHLKANTKIAEPHCLMKGFK